MNSAAIAGIGANGLSWKYQIDMGGATKALGELNDRESEGDEIAVPEMETAVLQIVGIVRNFCKANQWTEGTTLPCIVDDLEMVADDCLDSVNYMMHELYDSFDYHRILAGR